MVETKDLTFRAFQAINKYRSEAVFPVCNQWISSDWSNALAGETGELCNIIKKIRRGETPPREAIEEELGGVVAYAFLTASYFGIDLQDAVVKTFNAVSEKKGSDILL